MRFGYRSVSYEEHAVPVRLTTFPGITSARQLEPAVPTKVLIRRLRVQLENGAVSSLTFTRSTFIEAETSDGTIIGVDRGRGYTGARDAPRPAEDDGEVSLYLESFHLYLELPLRLAAMLEDRTAPHIVAHVDERTRDGRRYDLVFAAPGSTSGAPDPNNDQYVLWIAADTGQTEIVEFTYREVLRGYSGALFHEGRTKLHGSRTVHYPGRIKITDGPQGDDSVHEFLIESARTVAPRE